MQFSSSEEIESDEENRQMKFYSLKPHFKTSMSPRKQIESEDILFSQTEETKLDEKLKKLNYRKEFKKYLRDKKLKKSQASPSPIIAPKISLLEVIDNGPSEHIDLEQSSQSQLSIRPDKESSFLSVNFKESKRRQTQSSFLSVNFRNGEKEKKDQKTVVQDFRYYRNAQRTCQQKLTFQDNTKKGDSLYIQRRKSRLSSQDQSTNKIIQVESNIYNLRRKPLNVTSIIPSQPTQFQQGSLLQQIQSAQKLYSYQHPEELLQQIGNQRKNSHNSGTSTPKGILKNSFGSSQENSKKSGESKLSIQSLNTPCSRSRRVKFSFTKQQARKQNLIS